MLIQSTFRGIHMPNKCAVLPSTSLMKTSSSFGVPLPYSHNHHNHRPRHFCSPLSSPPPVLPRHNHIASASSTQSVISNEWMYDMLVEADMKLKQPWIISFSPKSCPLATLLLQEKMLLEAQETYPNDHWETIWPLPGYPGVISLTRKVLRWVEPPEQREKYQEKSEEESGDRKPVSLVWSSFPGWKVERIALPDVNTHKKSRIDQDILVLRHRQREYDLIVKGNITPFKARKLLAKHLDDQQRNTFYKMLKKILRKIRKYKLNYKLTLYENCQSNSFIIVREFEPPKEKGQEKYKRRKPLLLFFEENFGEHSLDSCHESLPMLSLSVAASLGWERKQIWLSNGAPV